MMRPYSWKDRPELHRQRTGPACHRYCYTCAERLGRFTKTAREEEYAYAAAVDGWHEADEREEARQAGVDPDRHEEV